MPVSPNNLQFSLSSEYLDQLKSLSKDGESLGLTAKRILIEALNGSIGEEAISKDAIQLLYEKTVKCSKRGLDTEDRLDRLESELKEEFADTASAIKEVEDRIQAVKIDDSRLTDLESRLQKVEENLDLVFEAAETIEEREEPDKISQVMEAFKGVTKILSEHNSRLIAVESSHQEIIDRIQAVEIAIDCQHYGDEVKELRGQVDELRKLVYQLTSPVKRR
jgi:hypothetical protein